MYNLPKEFPGWTLRTLEGFFLKPAFHRGVFLGSWNSPTSQLHPASCFFFTPFCTDFMDQLGLTTQPIHRPEVDEMAPFFTGFRWSKIGCRFLFQANWCELVTAGNNPGKTVKPMILGWLQIFPSKKNLPSFCPWTVDLFVPYWLTQSITFHVPRQFSGVRLSNVLNPSEILYYTMVHRDADQLSRICWVVIM